MSLFGDGMRVSSEIHRKSNPQESWPICNQRGGSPGWIRVEGIPPAPSSYRDANLFHTLRDWWCKLTPERNRGGGTQMEGPGNKIFGTTTYRYLKKNNRGDSSRDPTWSPIVGGHRSNLSKRSFFYTPSLWKGTNLQNRNRQRVNTVDGSGIPNNHLCIPKPCK